MRDTRKRRSTLVRRAHRPATFERALDLLASGALHPEALLSAERPLDDLEGALRSMMRKEALKVVIRQ